MHELASVLAPPPPPSLDTWYDLSIDTGNPIGTVLRVGSSIIMAAEAEKAAERMREALDEIDVPAVVLEESSARCARALGAAAGRATGATPISCSTSRSRTTASTLPPGIPR